MKKNVVKGRFENNKKNPWTPEFWKIEGIIRDFNTLWPQGQISDSV